MLVFFLLVGILFICLIVAACYVRAQLLRVNEELILESLRRGSPKEFKSIYMDITMGWYKEKDPPLKKAIMERTYEVLDKLVNKGLVRKAVYEINVEGSFDPQGHKIILYEIPSPIPSNVTFNIKIER